MHIDSSCAGAVVARAMGRLLVVPETVGGPGPRSVGSGPTLWWWEGDGWIVVLVALPLGGTVCIWGMGEVLVGVWKVELEEGGGMIGEWARSDDGDIAHDKYCVRWGGRGEGRAGVGGGGGEGEEVIERGEESHDGGGEVIMARL